MHCTNVSDFLVSGSSKVHFLVWIPTRWRPWSEQWMSALFSLLAIVCCSVGITTIFVLFTNTYLNSTYKYLKPEASGALYDQRSPGNKVHGDDDHAAHLRAVKTCSRGYIMGFWYLNGSLVCYKTRDSQCPLPSIKETWWRYLSLGRLWSQYGTWTQGGTSVKRSPRCPSLRGDAEWGVVYPRPESRHAVAPLDAHQRFPRWTGGSK